MNQERYPNPHSSKSRSRILYLLGIVGLGLLVGTIVFAVSVSIFQQLKQTGTPASSPLSQAPGNAPPSSTTGPYGFTVLHLTSSTAQYLKQLSVTWVRYQLNWGHIEPQPGRFDWTELDAAVNLANSNGLHMTFPLQVAPDWARTVNCAGSPHFASVEAMVQYATAIAQRYNGHNGHGYIDSYEVGNEEYDNAWAGNMANSIPCRDASLYGPTLKATYLAIKAQSPNALVGMFGMWWENTPHIHDYMLWLYQHGYGRYFDFANFHHYGCSTSPAESVGDRPSFTLEWQTIRQIMVQNGDARKPIWVTEIGYATTSVNRGTRCLVSPQVQAQYMSYVLNDALNSHAIQHIFWYTIGNKDGMSITQPGGNLPSFYLLQTFIQQHPGWG